jgi:NTP pyrophosphatase (non-canonical NTP hydrolase)
MSFVERVTSETSNDLVSFVERTRELHNDSVNAPLLLTAAIGLGSEGGEFQEIVKKLFFQGKPLTGETMFHMKRELGDIIWYWVNACRALGYDPQCVINENVAKLQARYDATFSVERSENRAEGDL